MRIFIQFHPALTLADGGEDGYLLPPLNDQVYTCTLSGLGRQLPAFIKVLQESAKKLDHTLAETVKDPTIRYYQNYLSRCLPRGDIEAAIRENKDRITINLTAKGTDNLLRSGLCLELQKLADEWNKDRGIEHKEDKHTQSRVGLPPRFKPLARVARAFTIHNDSRPPLAPSGRRTPTFPARALGIEESLVAPRDMPTRPRSLSGELETQRKGRESPLSGLEL